MLASVTIDQFCLCLNFIQMDSDSCSPFCLVFLFNSLTVDHCACVGGLFFSAV